MNWNPDLYKKKMGEYSNVMKDNKINGETLDKLIKIQKWTTNINA